MIAICIGFKTQKHRLHETTHKQYFWIQQQRQLITEL